MHFKRILNLLKEMDGQLIVLLCHHNADPDAICSAYAFSQLIKKVQPNVEIELAAAQGISKLSKKILTTIPIGILSSPRIEEADAIILLDTNTTQQLDDWKQRVERSGKPLIVIDHHALHPKTQRSTSLCIVDEEASSTCEIVFELFKQARIKPEKMDALALFLGMAYDTKHFAIAASKAFKIAAQLVEAGVNAKEALSLLETPMSHPERVARLKAASRLSILEIGGWLLCLSRVSSYQASAARALMRLGADVAIVGGEKGGILKISMRSSREFYEKTGIHLGKNITKALGAHIHGVGGGHNSSAGFNGEGSLEEVFKECVKLFHENLKC